MRKSVFLLSLLIDFISSAQTPDRWATIVNWDGVSVWQKYMIYSPGFMGPNALPIPSMGNGDVDSINYMSVSGTFFFSKADNTQNLKIFGNYCLVKDFISFDASYIPVEWFNVSSEEKDRRHIYWKNYHDSKAAGDVFFNMNLRLLKKWDKHVKLCLRVGYRFPTSGDLGSARYTNAPGYFFDISAGKPISSDNRWKLTGIGGIYVWQLNNFGQNDAFLFGVGIENTSGKWFWQLNGRGYAGWKGNGDSPFVISSSLRNIQKKIACFITVQQGLFDFKYSSFETGIKYLLLQKQK